MSLLRFHLPKTRTIIRTNIAHKVYASPWLKVFAVAHTLGPGRVDFICLLYANQPLNSVMIMRYVTAKYAYLLSNNFLRSGHGSHSYDMVRDPVCWWHLAASRVCFISFRMCILESKLSDCGENVRRTGVHNVWSHTPIEHVCGF